MKIEGWNIDGYGAFHDARVDDLTGGVTVFLGQNEAGKSTLLSYLRGMLFGFSDRRSRENLYPPLAGGRHGGTLVLRDDDAVWTLTRYAEKGKPFTLRGPDGHAADESDLRRLLGGVDGTLFKSVYAFSLDELQRFATLDEEGVRERIFSVGITGAGVSARAVLRDLDDREAALLKQKMARSRISNLVLDIGGLESEAREAAIQAIRYPSLLAEEHAHEDALREQEATFRSLAGSRRRLEILTALRPELDESERLRAALAALPEPATFDEEERIARLLGEQLIVRNREQTVEELSVACGAAEAELRTHVERLGADWTIDRVRSVDDSLAARDAIRGWRLAIAGAQEALSAAERDERTARDASARLADDHRRCTLEQPEAPPASAESLVSREAALRGLRTQLRDLQMAELHSETLREGARPPVWRSLGAAAALLLVGAGVAAAAGQPQIAVGLAIGGAVLAVIAMVEGVRAGRGGRQSAASSPDAVTHLRTEVARGGRELGLGDRPTEIDLNRLDAELAAARDQRVKCDGGEAQVRDLAAKLASAEATVGRAATAAETARAELAGAEEGWRAWLMAHGLPRISADGALELLDEVRHARQALDTRASAEGAIAQITAQRADWNHAAAALLGEDAPAGESPDGAALLTRLQERARVLEERRLAIQRLEGCEKRLAAGLASLGDARHALAELHAGDPDSWREEMLRTDQQIDESGEARTRAIEARRDAQRARQALEESADVPRLQADLESKRAELAAAVHEYRVIRTASGLVQSTLEGYMRDRQPGVLARASAAFSVATNGRFRAVLQDAAADSDAVVVEQWDGTRLAPDQLSRGTAEQLYLAIRLALVEEYAARGHELPLIMDDCLVNFDPGRAAAMARLIAESAAGGQCLFFTCHPSVAALFEHDPDHPARVLLLPGRPASPGSC